MSDPGKILFYPAWVSNHAGRRGSLCWGKPCDSCAEAKALGRAEVDAGRATLAFVVEFAGGVKRPLWKRTYPAGAAKIIGHWEELMAATEGPEETRR